jgi:beta-lactamase regulating signal transducer with metallopeptidase domain/ankyrin repeat protein
MSADAISQAVLWTGDHLLVALAVKATLAMLAALLLIRLARGASASLRHLVAAATFGVLLLLPLAARMVPARVITVPAAVVAARAPSRPAVEAAAAVTREAARPVPPASGLQVADVLAVVLGVHLLGALWLVGSLLVGVGRLHRTRQRAEVSVAGTRLANAMAREQGMSGGIEVAVSHELAVPVTFGAAHPVILLPAETREWDEEELGRALRHELEHIARADWATHLVSRIALALYWTHPLAWTLWRRLRLEAERACDDAVLRGQGRAEPYAEQLVSLARRLRGHGAVPALSMATRTNLGQRVDAILDEGRRRAPRSRALSVGVAAAAMAAVLALAPLQVMGALAVDVSDEDGDPLDVALMEAAEKGDLAAMERLLERGAKADAVMPGDGSPLIGAARRGRLEAIKRLLAAGANVNRGVEGDGSALIAAAREGHLEAVRLLLDGGAEIDLGVPGDGNALIMAAGDGQLEVVRFLLERGASVEKVVPGDENALIHASEGGQADVVRLLLERGADVNARVWADSGPGRGEWRTALKMARRNGHDEVARILAAAGAKE